VTRSDLADEAYVNLETFKRDGSGVRTPVWVASLDGKMVIFTDGTSYKVKRLRRNPKVCVAACDVRGGTAGPWAEGTCTIVDAPDREERAYEVLRAKYGLQMRAIDFFSWLFGRIGRRVILEVALGEG
jgi:hypothetical protein